jgi:hypothetical protein
MLPYITNINTQHDVLSVLKIVCLYSNYATRYYNVADSNYSGNCSGLFYEFPITGSVQSEQQLLLGILTQQWLHVFTSL